MCCGRELGAPVRLSDEVDVGRRFSMDTRGTSNSEQGAHISSVA